MIGAVFDHTTVRASIIADGYHCDPATIRIAHKLLGKRLFLISDALFASSPGQELPRPYFTLGEFAVHYEPDVAGPGRYVNNEGKLAGSALTLIDCVRVCVVKAGLPLTDALRMATIIPAEIIGNSDSNLVRLLPEIKSPNEADNSNFQYLKVRLRHFVKLQVFHLLSPFNTRRCD